MKYFLNPYLRSSDLVYKNKTSQTILDLKIKKIRCISLNKRENLSFKWWTLKCVWREEKLQKLCVISQLPASMRSITSGSWEMNLFNMRNIIIDYRDYVLILDFLPRLHEKYKNTYIVVRNLMNWSMLLY